MKRFLILFLLMGVALFAQQHRVVLFEEFTATW